MAKTKKKTRRKNGEGSIYLMKDGRFGAAVSLAKGKDGKRRRAVITGKTEEDVQVKMHKLLEKNGLIAEAGNEKSSINKSTLVEGFVKEFVKGNLTGRNKISSRTLENYKYCLKHFENFFEGKPIGSIDESDLNRFFRDMENKMYSDSLLNRTFILVARMYKRAAQKGFIEDNPLDDCDFDKPESKKETQPVTSLTDDEVNELFNILSSSEIIYPVFRFMLYTGVRTQEALALRWRDLDLDSEKGSAHIQQALTIDVTYDSDGNKHRDTIIGNTKTKCSKRMIGLSGDMVQFLKSWKKQAPEISKTGIADDDFVFGNSKNTHWTYSGFRCSVNKYIEKHSTNLNKLCLHKIRHTVATILAANGADVFELMSLLGHTQVQTAKRYVDLASEQFDDVDLKRREKCLIEKGFIRKIG